MNIQQYGVLFADLDISYFAVIMTVPLFGGKLIESFSSLRFVCGRARSHMCCFVFVCVYIQYYECEGCNVAETLKR